MKVMLKYSTKSYVELPLPSSPMLSPFDYEHVVLEDYALQPEITPAGIISEPVFVKTPECEGAIYINRDKVICRAEAGFSHPARGVAVVKTSKGYKTITSSEVLDCERAVYATIPGAFIVACYEGPATHVVTANYTGVFVFREAYSKKRPVSTHIGFNSYSVVFEDKRSVVIRGNSLVEIGIPLIAVAHTSEATYGLSGKWLVKITQDYKPLVALDVEPKFIGVTGGLPVFNTSSKLYRLEGGALVELDYVKGLVNTASAQDIIVVDNSTHVKAYDPAGRLYLELPKSRDVKCWATRYGVLCCRSGLCGIIEPGTSIIQVNTVNKEAHELRVASDIPLLVNYKDAVHRCKPGNVLNIREESASVLRKHLFELVLDHVLSSEYLSLASPPARIIVEASGKAYESSGLHECGGLSLVELRVGKLEKPSRVRLEVLGGEIATGINTLCSDSSPDKLVIEAIDTIIGDRVQLSKVIIEKNYVPPPKYTVNVKHGKDHSIIDLNIEDGELIKAALKCRNIEIELKQGSNIVENCVFPASIHLTLKKQGFIYSYKRDIVVPGLLDIVLRASSVEDVNIGGFKLRITPVAFPELAPISRIKVVIGRNVELVFRSKVAGRVVVVSQSSVRWYQVRPGLNSVLAAFSDTYYLVFDTGYSKYTYKIEIPLHSQLQIAEAQAKALLRELKIRGLRI